MTKANPAYITIGKIGAAYGVHGWLKIHSYTEYGAGILEYSPWLLSGGDNSRYEPVKVEDGKIHNNGIIVKFADINSPEEARLLTGKTIAITRDQLPELKQNEFYWSDLVGMTVINKNGENYGKVEYFIETGSNDVMVVKNTKEYAIPCLFNSVILKVDLEKKEILVDWELI